MMRWNRIREIVKKEFLQALREPRMRAVLIGPPLLQLLIFGYAVNLDVESSTIAWQDFDRTSVSKDLRAAFAGSPRFEVVDAPDSQAGAQALLDRGRVQGIVRILPGFGRDIQRGHTGQVQILVDGTNSNTASIVAGYATQVTSAFSAKTRSELQRSRLALTIASGAAAGASPPDIDVRPRVWFNPDLKSRNYFVPGVVVNIIALVTLMLTAMAIVREKEIGTMEQLIVTPIRPLELIVGKMLPFSIVGLFDVILVTSAALLVFHIPLRGSVLLLLGSAVLFLMTTIGAGLFISTISHTQQQAMMASFFFFMPAFLLSGFAFPIRNMPVIVQYLTYLNPVRYFIEIVRGIFLKGTGIAVLWPELVALGVYGVLVLGFSSARFHKRLD